MAWDAIVTTASSGGLCTVRSGKTFYKCQVIKGLSVGVGDKVIGETVRTKRTVIGVIGAIAPPSRPVNDDDEPDPKPTTVTGDLVVPPVETVTWRNGRWRPDLKDVMQGDYGGQNTIGTIFYGSAAKSLKGSTVTEATIDVVRVKGGSRGPRATTMRLVTQTKRPSGSPTLGASVSGPYLGVGEQNGGFVIPDSWGQAMVNGTAGGIAFYDADADPFVRFAGRGTYAPAFTLTINWKRTS